MEKIGKIISKEKRYYCTIYTVLYRKRQYKMLIGDSQNVKYEIGKNYQFYKLIKGSPSIMNTIPVEEKV